MLLKCSMNSGKHVLIQETPFWNPFQDLETYAGPNAVLEWRKLLVSDIHFLFFIHSFEGIKPLYFA